MEKLKNLVLNLATIKESDPHLKGEDTMTLKVRLDSNRKRVRNSIDSLSFTRQNLVLVVPL